MAFETSIGRWVEVTPDSSALHSPDVATPPPTPPSA